MGVGRFHFSDRYSVFDWGVMPDPILRKGEALSVLSGYFFEKLSEVGIPHHYRGMVFGGEVVPLSKISHPTPVMEVSLVRVLRPIYKDGRHDYSLYEREKGNFLIPLECIYRNSLPKGSSVFRRLSKGELTPSDFGVEKVEPGITLPRPFLDLSTKLEDTDRYISWEEGKVLGGVTEEEVEEIRRVLLEIDRLITEEVESLGILHEDGKVEFAFKPDRTLMVVDVFGTPDESRFTVEGIPLSKEILRFYYRKTPWYEQWMEVKEKGKGDPKIREKVPPPPPLPERWKEGVSHLYTSFTVTRREWFPSPPFSTVLDEIRRLWEEVNP